MAVYALDGLSPTFPEDGSHYIAPNAQVMGNVVMHENSSVWFGAVLRGDNDTITIGRRSNVQDNAVLHTDPGCPLNIGEGVIIGHQVMLHGCTIGDNTLIGIGAVILNNVFIGKNCIIGAGALLTENKVIPDNSLVVGSPGKVVREVTDAQADFLKLNAEVYVKNAQRFRAGLKRID